jgi:hypothetical protein
LLAVWPGAGNCQEQQLVNWKLVPGLAPVRVAFHWLVTVTVCAKFSVTVQLLSAVVPVLVTDTSTWKKPPCVLEGVAVQLCAANACPFNDRPSNRPDSSVTVLMKAFMYTPRSEIFVIQTSLMFRPGRQPRPGMSTI